MKRSEIRRAELKRGTERMKRRHPTNARSKGLPKRKKGIRPINRKRAAAKLLRNFGSPEFRAWCHQQPCQFCGERARQWWNRDYFGHDMAHADARGFGGCGGDWTKVTIACPDCHEAGKPTKAYAAARETQRRWLVECERRAG